MTLKIISFAFVAFSCLFHSSAVAAQPKLRIWGQIPFVAQGSFLEFRATMGKTREQARKDLLDLFGSLYLPSVMAGADAASAAEALSKVIINFDRLREEHVRYANQGIPEALESRFIAHFEDYYRSEGLSEEERRAEFLRVGGWNDAMKKLRLGSIQSKERDRLFMDLFEKLDYLLYGSYTILSNGGVALTLNAEKYGTGELRSFSAEGNIEQAIAALAREFFEFAQSNARQTWTNPLEGLEWVLPPPNLQGSQLPREIQLFCEGQNARIPFARELVLAAQGGRYRAGGIPVIGPEDIYLVADQQRYPENHFYFGSYHTGEDPRGPVRSSAGYGTIRPKFVCVRGDVSVFVRWEQDIYRALRKANLMPPEKRASVQGAIEYLLFRLDAYGNKGSWVENNFSSVSDAMKILIGNGFQFSGELKKKISSLE